MKVYWYECGRQHGNLGDTLTPLLLDYFGVEYEWSPPEKAELFGIGSILHRVPPGFRGTIWSTGALIEGEFHDLSTARIFALRGKLSLSYVECSEPEAVVLGDGGLLAHLLFRPSRKRYKLGVIPHYSHAGESVFTELDDHSEIKRIDICDEPRAVIQQIGQCEHIISSSLHGLIIADSLGVPNRWVDIAGESSTILGHGFKFRDYYSNFAIDDPEPTLLRSGWSLDELLPLFENYQRATIDEHKQQLLESFRDVAGPASCYAWDMAKRDIASRQQTVLQRLWDQNAAHAELLVKGDAPGVGSGNTSQRQSIDEVRDNLKSDARLLGRFLVECLSQLQSLHQLGIVHGDIREANIVLEDGRPILTNLGWRVPTEDTQTISYARYVATDLRAIGRLVRDMADKHPHLGTIASLLMRSQPHSLLIDAEAACELTELVLGDAEKGEGGADGAQLQAAMTPKLSRAVQCLLEAIASQDRTITDLQEELAAVGDRQWRNELSLAALQLASIIREDEMYVLIDDDAWRGGFIARPKSVPFLERNGMYWGPPENDAVAIRELTELQRRGARYVVIGKPAFWWMTYYAGLCNYLDTVAQLCYKDELLWVYRFWNN